MAERDPEFDDLILPLLDTVFDVALRLTGRRHEAQDLTQETYLRAFAAFARFERGSSPRAWLLTILRNCHRNRVRDASRHPDEALEDVAMPEATATAESAESADWQLVTPEDLDDAVRMLALHHREVVILRDLQGLSYQDVARLLALPQGTVMSRLHRARAELRRILVWRLRGHARRRAQ